MKHSNQRFRLRDLYSFSGYKFCDSFVDNDSILVVLKRTGKTGKCPVCGKRCRNIHKKRKRRIRDLDLAGSKAYVWFAYFDIVCSCGYEGVEKLDFVESYSRFTRRFEKKVVTLCEAMCIKDVAKELRVGWETVKNIDKRNAQKYVVDLESVSPKRIGVDEIAYEKSHKYLTVVRDVDLSKVIWVGKGRKRETLDKFFEQLGIEKSWNIHVAVCDMWDAYISSIKANTNASIVFDKFHIAKVVNDAIDKVRRKEFAKADSQERKNMKHKRFLILSRQKNLKSEKTEQLKQLLEQNNTLYTTYVLKEQILDILDSEKHGAKIRLNTWLKNVFSTGIDQLQQVAKRICNYLYGIYNYFDHKITNAQSEGFNNKINIIKRKAYGFRDLEYFKLKILQTC